MFDVPLNRALNKEVKYYGLSYLGIIGASVIGLAIWIRFSMTFGILGFILGYGIAAIAAKAWHCGNIQKVMYWHLPSKGLFGGRYLPKSHHRCLL